MMNDAWYTKTPEEIEKILKTNAAVGLTRKAARIRLRKDGPNALYQIPQSKTRSYIGKIAFDFTSLLLLLTVGVAWIFEYRQTAAVILSVWLINFVLTALTYVKSQQIFSAIYTYSIPEMCVLREGRLVLIDSRSIVCGDVIFLREGDVVVCDARIVSAENLMVVEADLCGGGTPVHKNAENLFDARRGLSEQSNMVFASSTVVGGSGRAIVVATGEDTRIYMKKGPIPLESHSEFPLLRQVKKYCRIQGLAAIALVFVITLLDLVLSLRGGELFDVFLTALCLAVASMSELLWALGYIILARGLAGAALISKEGSGGAIIKNISKIEKLSLLDCIIIDSGSIYDRSRLEITALYTGGKLYRQPDLGRGIKDNSCGIDLLKNALVVSGALHGRSSLAQNTGDFTDGEALLSVAEEARIDLSALAGDFPLLERCGRGHGSLFDTVLTSDEEGHTAIVRGEPAEILGRCTTYCDWKIEKSLDASVLREILQIGKDLYEEGCQVYAVARSKTIYNNLRRIGAVQREMCFVGLIAQREHLNEGAFDFIEYCRRMGMRTIMLHDGSAADLTRLAIGCGIRKKEDIDTNVYSAALGRDSLCQAVPECDLYAGLDSQGKLSLIETLKQSGHRVGAVSNRFADLRLLYEADVSFTTSLLHYRTQKARETKLHLLRATYCQALKRRADVLIAASPMACIKAVEYAKSIYTNFKSAADYLIMMQLLRLFLIIYSVVTGIESVTATGILVSGLIFDYAVVMVFAFEKPLYKPSVKKGEQTPQEQRKLSSVTLSVVLIALLWSVIVIALPLAFRGTEIFSSDREVESYAFVALLFAQLLLVFVNRTGWRDADSRLQISPMLIGYCGAIIAFIACAVLVPSFGMLFGVFELGAVSFILALCPSIVMIAAFMIDRRLRRGGKQ